MGYTAEEVAKEIAKTENPINTVMNNAANAYKTAGLSANEYMASATSMAAALNQATGDMAVSANYVDMAITDMSDNANKMGTSMENIQNAYNGFTKQNFTMLDNLKLGYGGTKEEMERLLADATAISGIEYDVKNYADIVDAIHIIQTEMGIAGTTAKEASETISGSVASARSAWENLVVGIADDNADFDTLVNNFVESVGIAGENLLPRIETAITGAGSLIEKLLPVIVEKIPSIVNNVLPGLLSSGANMAQALFDGISENIPALLGVIEQVLPQLIVVAIDFVTGFASAIWDNKDIILESIANVISAITEAISEKVPALEPVMTAIDYLVEHLEELAPIVLAIVSAIVAYKTAMEVAAIAQAALNLVMSLNPIGIIIALVAALVAAFIYLWNNCDSFRQFWVDLWEGIKAVFSGAIDGIVTFFTKTIPEAISTAIEWFAQLPENIAYALGYAIGSVIQFGIDLVDWAKTAIPEFIANVITFFSELPGKIWTWLVNTITKIIEWRVNLIKTGTSAAKGLFEAVINGIKSLPENILEIGKNIVSGLWNGISSGWDWLVEKVRGLANSLLSGVKDALGVHSPSTKFKYLGEMCVAGFDEGVDDLFDTDTLNKSINASFGTLSANVKYANAEEGSSGIINTDEIKSAVAAGAREGIESADIKTYLSGKKVSQGVDKELGATEVTKGRYGT